MIKDLSAKWADNVWLREDYIKVKHQSFELIESFLVNPPKTILDIGCGLAYESELFQKKYQSKLYLLDGDFDESKETYRDRKFGDVGSFQFYTRISSLENSFIQRGLDYTFVNANKIELSENIVFDLVYSNVSCGYHYPLSTYIDLIKKHTNDESLLIFDLHARFLKNQTEKYFEIIEMKSIDDSRKILKCSLRLKKGA